MKKSKLETNSEVNDSNGNYQLKHSDKADKRLNCNSLAEQIEIVRKRIQFDHKTGCWNWTGARQSKAYRSTKYNGTMKFHGRIIYAHQFLYEITNGPLPCWLELDHKCENSMCVNPDHLEPVTHRENIDRARSRGTYACGEAASNSKTNEKVIALVRDLHYCGLFSRAELCDIFDQPGMSGAIAGTSWSHVGMPDFSKEIDKKTLRTYYSGLAQIKVPLVLAFRIYLKCLEGVPVSELAKTYGIDELLIRSYCRKDSSIHWVIEPNAWERIHRHIYRLSGEIWKLVTDGKLDLNIATKLLHRMTMRFGVSNYGAGPTEEKTN